MKRATSYLSILLLASSSLMFVHCKKYQYDESAESEFLEVEEKNSSLLLHYANTMSANSGGAGYTQFTNFLSDYDSTEVVITITQGNLGGGENDTIFDANSEAFDILATSTFQTNYGLGNAETAIDLHASKETIVNANYELEVTDTKIYIKTTTKFFKETSGEEFFLTPYVVVDSIVAGQTGHPDGAFTNHRKVAASVGRLNNFPVRYLGYSVASDQINAGYQFNQTFITERRAEWTDPDQISVALVLTKRNPAGDIVFVNAHTNN